MQIDRFPRLQVNGVAVDKASLLIAQHVNDLTDLVVQLNNEQDRLRKTVDDLQKQLVSLQAQGRRL